LFTGIVEEVGKIKDIGPKRLTVDASKVIDGVNLGDSIAVNGACLTVISSDSKGFTVELMPETRRRTTFKNAHPGDPVNLERALSASGRLGGHFVQGHIDGTGKVISCVPEGDAVIMKAAVAPEIAKYLVIKGFIAVEGVSLTVVDCDSASFSVSLVSFSRENTTLGNKKTGSEVNLEIDILAKYIEKLADKKNDEVFLDFLQGYDTLSKGRI
jgi:riboflavin synthase